MVDETTLAQMNGTYSMPADAGPAWRSAVEYGFDMSLVEQALQRSPEERLEAHQQALNLIIAAQSGSTAP